MSWNINVARPRRKKGSRGKVNGNEPMIFFKNGRIYGRFRRFGGRSFRQSAGTGGARGTSLEYSFFGGGRGVLSVDESPLGRCALLINRTLVQHLGTFWSQKETHKMRNCEKKNNQIHSLQVSVCKKNNEVATLQSQPVGR